MTGITFSCVLAQEFGGRQHTDAVAGVGIEFLDCSAGMQLQ